MKHTRRILTALAAASVAACASDSDRAGRIVGDAFLAMDVGREVNLVSEPVRLIEDVAELDSILALACQRRDRELARLGAAGAPDTDARLEARDSAWAERRRILGGRVLRTDTTDEGARFAFDSVAPGRYRLWAEAAVGDERYTWLAPVRVRAGDSLRVNLTNANLDESPFRCGV